jgi:osmotically-inducible protein OsmY
MKRSRQSRPLTNGDYERANYNRERGNEGHNRYPSRDDRQHQQDAWEKNRNSDQHPQESSFIGNMSQREGTEYEKEAGYRERIRKIGEGPLQKNQNQAWPHYKGEHHGKGPKNYNRSTERILDDVHQQLTDHPALDATDVEVSMENGDLILTGTVETRQAKRLAEDICEQVRGVKNVENRLRVQHSIGNGVSVGNP